MSVCRLCLSNNATDYIDITQNPRQRAKFSNIIQTHLNLKNNYLNIVSNKICIDCYFKINDFHKYCQRIKQTQRILRNSLNKTLNEKTRDTTTGDIPIEEFHNENLDKSNSTPRDRLQKIYNMIEKDEVERKSKAAASSNLDNICPTAMAKTKEKLAAITKSKLKKKTREITILDKHDFSKLSTALVNADVDPMQLYVLERLKNGHADVPLPSIKNYIQHDHEETESIKNLKNVHVSDFDSIMKELKQPKQEQLKDYFKCEHCLEAFRNTKIIKEHEPTCENCPLHNFIFPPGIKIKNAQNSRKVNVDKPQKMFKLY